MPKNDSRWRVRLAEAAEIDLDAITDYFVAIEEHDLADAILDDFEKTKKSLEVMPGRAHFTEELKNIGVYSHREVHFRTYRVIFRMDEEQRNVLVDAILDGRRNVATLLADRLLRVAR